VIPTPVRSEILHRIEAAEREHDVRVLLAVESGSRAWGFASPNSDYDARFIYVHRQNWYLSVALEEQRDVIEYPIVDDIDLNGWDLRKALRLFWKSNPAFVEWIQSPIVYVQVGGFAAAARDLLPSVYSVTSGAHHYHSTAKTFRGYLTAETVPLKKYFYVLRPLLAARWLERYGTAAPIEFARLLPIIESAPGLVADIEGLLERKKGAPEMGVGPRVPSINEFIDAELRRLEERPRASAARGHVLPVLDHLFRRTVQEAWV